MINFKKFNMLLPASVLGLSLAFCSSSGEKQESQKPNFLFIVSEDHGPQLGCYGDPYIETPNIDKLANDGVRFSHAYVTQAGCSPSRASILTGLYPHQNGQIGLATHKYRMYNPDTPNMPGILKQNGYRTGCIGKIHVNPENAFDYDVLITGKFTSFNGRDIKRIAEVADTFIRASTKPFFLWISYPDAHTPFIRQKDSIPANPLEPQQISALPHLGLNTPETLETVANYYSCIERLDTGICMLMEVLRKSDKTGNTLVIFLSDHGMQAPRGKRTCYEGGVKIPMIMYWPDRIPEGNVIDELVSTIDLMPTILDFAGVKEKPETPGRSLLPVLRRKKIERRKYLFTEYNVHWPENLYPQRTVRDAQFKLIQNLFYDRENPSYKQYLIDRNPQTITPEDIVDAPDSVKYAYKIFQHPPEFELYDLQSDEWEYHNLSENPEYTEVLDRLKEALKDWREKTNDPLLHKDILHKFDLENKSTFVNGKYVHVRTNKDFEWKYPEYFFPVKNKF